MLGMWGGEAGGRQRRRAGFCNLHTVCCGWDFFFPELCTRTQSSERWGAATYPTSVSPPPPSTPQASQLGVYRAFVDNYGVAMETAEKCCQANAQFAEISEVMSEPRAEDTVQARVLLTPTVSSHSLECDALWDGRWENKVDQIKGWV